MHFGHNVSKVNPKMMGYVHSERDDIHIIDLEKTVKKLDKACRFVRETVANGGEILFVGNETVKEEAERCNMPYLTSVPSAIFVVGELNIPIIAILDTNCDPDGVDYVIPGNDEGVRAIKLITSKIADAILNT